LELSNKELQFRIIYSIIVAGKSAGFAENATKKLFQDFQDEPFDIIRNWINNGILKDNLLKAKTGNYNKIEKCFIELVSSNVNLHNCLPEDLEKIHGIGPKTARFFILWTRPNACVAALDIHILRWLGAKGYKVPKVTPNGKKYKELENAFLNEAKLLKMSPAELDKMVWMLGSKNSKWNPDDFVSTE